MTILQLIAGVLAVLLTGTLIAVIVSAPVFVVLALAAVGSRTPDARTGRVAAGSLKGADHDE